MNLILIPLAYVPRVWPHATRWVKLAIERCGWSKFSDVERCVLIGRYQLWGAFDGAKDNLFGAVVTELAETEDGRVCNVVACGGKNAKAAMWLLDGIESYAKREGCCKVHMLCRRGWERWLPAYQRKLIVLEKRI